MTTATADDLEHCVRLGLRWCDPDDDDLAVWERTRWPARGRIVFVATLLDLNTDEAHHVEVSWLVHRGETIDNAIEGLRYMFWNGAFSEDAAMHEMIAPGTECPKDAMYVVDEPAWLESSNNPDNAE
jgi:hypothetical protein